MPVRIALFDDQALILDTFKVLLAEHPAFEVTGAFLETGNLAQKMATAAPDIVLMDLGIGPVDGIETTRRILEMSPSVKVVVQTIFDDDDKVFASVCAGASGYILKSDVPSRIVAALQEIAAGGAPMTPVIAAKVLRLFKSAQMQRMSVREPNLYQLTARELEILGLLVTGMSYKMIAGECGITYETVKSHIKRIYEKLHVASMTEAVAKAIHERLV